MQAPKLFTTKDNKLISVYDSWILIHSNDEAAKTFLVDNSFLSVVLKGKPSKDVDIIKYTKFSV